MQAKVLLTVWLIYDSPSDHPNRYVARQWAAIRGGFAPISLRCVVGERTPGTLASIREMLICDGFACIGRTPDDDPCVLETWI
jgi:hypothetical protein